MQSPAAIIIQQKSDLWPLNLLMAEVTTPSIANKYFRMIPSSSYIIPFSPPPPQRMTCPQVHSISIGFDLKTSSGWFPHVIIKVVIQSFVQVCMPGEKGAKGAEKDVFDEQWVMVESKEKILHRHTPHSRESSRTCWHTQQQIVWSRRWDTN